MVVLGIETSCDDTSIGIYDSERGVLSNVKQDQAMTTFFLVMEWFGRREECPLHLFTRIAYTPLRWAAYYFILLLIVFIGRFEEVNFIYFQF